MCMSEGGKEDLKIRVDSFSRFAGVVYSILRTTLVFLSFFMCRYREF